MPPSLQWPDYIVFCAFLVVSLGIGIFHSRTGGKQKSTQEFILANRKLHVIPTMLSLVASYTSAISIIGSTAEMYNWGIQAWPLGAVGTLGTSLIAERLIVPWIFPLKLVSSYEVSN